MMKRTVGPTLDQLKDKVIEQLDRTNLSSMTPEQSVKYVDAISVLRGGIGSFLAREASITGEDVKDLARTVIQQSEAVADKEGRRRRLKMWIREATTHQQVFARLAEADIKIQI